MTCFETKLEGLISCGKITDGEYKNFIKRGVQYEKFTPKFPILREIFPNRVPIDASNTFIESLDFPYQETSYVCPLSQKSPKTYRYKTNDKNEGIDNLLGANVL